jgi:hypothetical protein
MMKKYFFMAIIVIMLEKSYLRLPPPLLPLPLPPEGELPLPPDLEGAE